MTHQKVYESSTPISASSVPQLSSAEFANSGYEIDIDLEETTHEKYDEGEVNDDTGVRDEDELEKHGFRKVWTAWGGYPGDVPGDIEEFLDDDGRRGKYILFERYKLLNYIRFGPVYRPLEQSPLAGTLR